MATSGPFDVQRGDRCCTYCDRTSPRVEVHACLDKKHTSMRKCRVILPLRKPLLMEFRRLGQGPCRFKCNNIATVYADDDDVQ